MKNIYLIPTEKPSRFGIHDGKLEYATNFGFDFFNKENNFRHNPVNIHIVSDEKIKKDNYVLNTKTNEIYKVLTFNNGIPLDKKGNGGLFTEKIILTTDPDLITQGVQAIDDEFLNWFVNNQSREYVEFKTYCCRKLSENYCDLRCGKQTYKIIIPQEEPKQDTRVFGTRNDKTFWSDKPIQDGHPDKQENNKFLEKDTIISWNESINFLENYKSDEIVDVVDNSGKIDLEASKILKRLSELNREKELLINRLLETCKK